MGPRRTESERLTLHEQLERLELDLASAAGAIEQGHGGEDHREALSALYMAVAGVTNVVRQLVDERAPGGETET